MEKIISYKDLVVWQKAKLLAIAIYELTERFPQSEIYGLTSQMRRSAVSIPSNIAEGRRRGSKNLDFVKIDKLLEEVMKILNVMTSIH